MCSGGDLWAQLGDLLKPRREAVDGPVVYFVDHFFRDHELIGRLPMEKGDQLHFVDSSSEPEVTRIDAFKEAVSAADSRTPCCVVGIGGGNALDTAKAVANLLTNPGKAEDYQGWELVKNPAVYKIGIPTLSGTGSECSRTCVLTNIPKNLKLGMNSDYTVYDQLLLDPDLLATVPPRPVFLHRHRYLHALRRIASGAATATPSSTPSPYAPCSSARKFSSPTT